jgi:hypothetical protein
LADSSGAVGEPEEPIAVQRVPAPCGDPQIEPAAIGVHPRRCGANPSVRQTIDGDLSHGESPRLRMTPDYVYVQSTDYGEGP